MSEDAVWIDVLPSMSKFSDTLGKEADAAAGKAGKSAGGKFGLAMAAGVTAVVGGVALAGKALYDLGGTFDDVTDTIRVGTGATGEALDGLVASAKNVATKVPADFESISTAVADINTRMGLTGPTLETFTGQVLEAGRLTGEAIDVNKVSAAFSVFGVEGEKSTAAMDTLYRVSQDTGVGINELAAVVQKAGPSVQALGFDFDQTAALIGGLDKAGLDASRMTAGLGKALVELAKEGEDPAKTFERVTGEIQAMAEAGDIAGATDMSAKLFGTKNAPQFMQALQQGKLDLDALTAAATGSGDTIMAASEDTADFAEQWTLFQNKMSILVAPIAEKVFGLIATGMTWINDVAVPYLEQFFAGWSSGTGPLTAVQNVFSSVVAVLRDALWPVFQVVSAYIRDVVWPIFQQLAGIVADVVVPVLQDLWAMFNEKVLPVLRSVADFIVKNVVPVIQDFATRVVLPLMKLIGQAIKGMWDNFAKPALNALWSFIKNYVGPVIVWLWDSVVSPTFKLIGDAVDGFGRNWADVWNGIKAAAVAPANFIIDVVWNNGLRKALNLIPGVDLGEAATIKVGSNKSGRGSTGGRTAHSAMAGGGILPGTSRYADGDDQLVWMRRGEGVTVTEALDPYEKARLLALNKAVLGGSSAAAFRDQFDGHAGGGIVGFRGHRFTSTFAAVLAAAEAMSGTRFHISQGGFRPRTSYSGTSHQGDAVDILGPITTAVITALRANGVAAWDRTGKGKWAPHIHGVPLPGFGRAGGSAIWQAQDYLRGGDGLGGRDNGPNVSPGIMGGLFEIPELINKALEQVKEGLVGPWGDLFKGGMLDVVGKAKDWALAELNKLGDSVGDMIFGNTSYNKGPGPKVNPVTDSRGYATGTNSALPGWAWVGELGLPELVEGPQLRYMQGGEKVTSSAMTRRLLGGSDSDRLRLVEGRLTLDEDGSAYIRGVAEDVFDDREDSARRWERMG